MNYQQIYDQLMNKRKAEPASVGDMHHILPRSWGGTDDQFNLVRLLPREHFIAHLLLIKLASSSNEKRKMLYAVHRMIPRGKRTSRMYESIRAEWIKAQIDYMNEIIGPMGETRRELTTRKSALTMATTIVDGISLAEHRFRKMSKHNVDVYEWEHKSGKTFTGTALELSRAHRGELIEPNKMIRNLGTPKYHRDWRSVEGGKQPSKIMKRYTTVRTWMHKLGECFTGTSFDLAEHVKGKQIMHPNRIERSALKGARLDGWKAVT